MIRGAENWHGLPPDERYRTSVNLLYPLLDKLRLQLGGDIYFQDYKNENTFFDNTVRKDRNYTGAIGLTWSVFKHVDLIAQYMYTRVNSNTTGASVFTQTVQSSETDRSYESGQGELRAGDEDPDFRRGDGKPKRR